MPAASMASRLSDQLIAGELSAKVVEEAVTVGGGGEGGEGRELSAAHPINSTADTTPILFFNIFLTISVADA
jgi:hypothetical protein